MDGFLAYFPEIISMNEVQSRINNAVASKVSVTDVQRIVNTSITDNTWPKTRSYTGTEQYVSLPSNTGSVTVTGVAQWNGGLDKRDSWTLPKSLAKGVQYQIGGHAQGTVAYHRYYIQFTGTQLHIWRTIEWDGGNTDTTTMRYDLTVTLTA